MAERRRLALTTEAQAELEQVRDHDPNPAMREHAAAVLKVASGQVAHQVALRGLLKPHDPDTVYHWLNLYEAGGVAGLRAHLNGGPHRSRLRCLGGADGAIARGATDGA